MKVLNTIIDRIFGLQFRAINTRAIKFELKKSIFTPDDYKIYYFWCAINNQPQADALFLNSNNSRRTLLNRKYLRCVEYLAL